MSTSILGTWNVWWLNDPLHHQPPPPPNRSPWGTCWQPAARGHRGRSRRRPCCTVAVFRWRSSSGGAWGFGVAVLLPGLVGLGKRMEMDGNLGGGFKYCLFSSLLGEDSHFDQYFSDGLKPPTRNYFWKLFDGNICQAAEWWDKLPKFCWALWMGISSPKQGEPSRYGEEKPWFFRDMVKYENA